MKKIVSARAKLTPAQAQKASRLLSSGDSQISVAQRLGVSQAAISMLARGLTYQKITGRAPAPSRRARAA